MSQPPSGVMLSVSPSPTLSCLVGHGIPYFIRRSGRWGWVMHIWGAAWLNLLGVALVGCWWDCRGEELGLLTHRWKVGWRGNFSVAWWERPGVGCYPCHSQGREIRWGSDRRGRPLSGLGWMGTCGGSVGGSALWFGVWVGSKWGLRISWCCKAGSSMMRSYIYFGLLR